MKSQDATATEAAVVAAINEFREEGCPVAHHPEVIAPIAIRRWFSSERRGVKQEDHRARIRDLAKGLVAQLERDPKLVGPLMRDYERVAERVARTLSE
jgi:hypothetical protein